MNRLETKKRKSKPLFSVKNMLFAAGWALFAYVAYKVTITKIDEYFWDPYDILGVSSSSTQAEIKKAFRKLSLQYHPDKVKDDLNGESEQKFVDISKAYKVLTNDDAKSIYDEFGHPDGKQS